MAKSLFLKKSLPVLSIFIIFANVNNIKIKKGKPIETSFTQN